MKKNDLSEVEASLQQTAFPRSVIIDTINKCNYKCEYCARSIMTRPKDLMDDSLGFMIVDQVAENNTNTILWLAFYGEALIAKDKVFRFAKRANAKEVKTICLNTNGSLLSDETIAELVDSGITRVICSLDGIREQTYDRLRRKGWKERVYERINKLLAHVDAKKSKLEVVAQIVENDVNRAEITEFTEYWNSRGAVVKVKDFVNWTEPSDRVDMSKRIACPWIFTTLPVLTNGDMVICGADYNAKCVVGNIYKESIFDVWNNQHRELRERHLQHEFGSLPEICMRCSDWNICGSEIVNGESEI